MIYQTVSKLTEVYCSKPLTRSVHLFIYSTPLLNFIFIVIQLHVSLFTSVVRTVLWTGWQTIVL